LRQLPSPRIFIGRSIHRSYCPATIRSALILFEKNRPIPGSSASALVVASALPSEGKKEERRESGQPAGILSTGAKAWPCLLQVAVIVCFLSVYAGEFGKWIAASPNSTPVVKPYFPAQITGRNSGKNIAIVIKALLFFPQNQVRSRSA